jgi:hypothetical protein
MAVSDETSAIIADEATSREVSPFSDRFPGFDLGDAHGIVNEIQRRWRALQGKLGDRGQASPHRARLAAHRLAEPPAGGGRVRKELAGSTFQSVTRVKTHGRAIWTGGRGSG